MAEVIANAVVNIVGGGTVARLGMIELAMNDIEVRERLFNIENINQRIAVRDTGFAANDATRAARIVARERQRLNEQIDTRLIFKYVYN